MARGWESKSVESQIELAEARKDQLARVRMTAEEAERRRQRESLLLSRASVLRQMEASRNARYKNMLAAALEELDDKLARLE
jgi:hypothetical protein